MFVAVNKGVGTGLRIAYWLSILAIVIALVLIIVSVYCLYKQYYKTGLGLFVTSLLMSGGAFYTIHRVNMPTGEYIKDAYNRRGAKLFGKIGQGEFDGETVMDVKYDDGCGCNGGKEEDFDEDINELDYIESSDDEAENLPDSTTSSRGKKVRFGSCDEICDNLKSILTKLNINHDLEDETETEKILDYIMKNIDNILESYRKLDLDGKKEIDELLDILDTESSDIKDKIKNLKDKLSI